MKVVSLLRRLEQAAKQTHFGRGEFPVDRGGQELELVVGEHDIV